MHPQIVWILIVDIMTLGKDEDPHSNIKTNRENVSKSYSQEL